MPLSLSEILEEFVKGQLDRENFYSIVGKAVNVDETARTCDLEPIEDEATRSGIRLQSAIDGDNGFVLIPKEDSFIVVSFFDTRTGFVSLTSELEKIIWDVELTQINGGDNGGLINIEPLIDKINQLESDINDLKKVFLTTWTPVSQDGGAALKIAAAAWAASIFIETKKSELEDTKVTH